MKQIFDLFRVPSADHAARQMLAQAKRDLLKAEAQREHAALIAAYQRSMVARLTSQIASGELL